MKYITILISCLFVLSIWSCGDDPVDPIDNNPDPSELSFTLSGGSYDNKLFEINNFFDRVSRSGFVDSLGGFTDLFSVGEFDTKTIVLEMRIPGSKADTVFYDSNTSDYVTDYRKYFNLTVDGNVLLLRNVNILINEYGAVGDRIKGVFNAQVIDFSQGTGGSTIVYVNDGKFDLVRKQ